MNIFLRKVQEDEENEPPKKDYEEKPEVNVCSPKRELKKNGVIDDSDDDE